METLPVDLQVCVRRLRSGERLQVKMLLDEVPGFEGLKLRAEENNHAGDAKNPNDKFLKSVQQRCINMARVQAVLYPQLVNEYAVLAQQLFYYTMDTEGVLLRERKRRSLPGNVAETENAMFTSEDLKRDQQVSKINSAGLFHRKNMSHFPNPAGHKSFKFKPKWNAGKGKSGGWNQFKPWRPWYQAPSGSKGRGKGKACCRSLLSEASCAKHRFINKLQGPWAKFKSSCSTPEGFWTWQSKGTAQVVQAWQPQGQKLSAGPFHSMQWSDSEPVHSRQDPLSGTVMGENFIMGKTGAKIALVRAKCPPPHCENHQDRSPSRLFLVQSAAIQAMSKVSRGGVFDKTNFKGLPGVWQ